MKIFKKNEFVGLALEGDVIRIAHLKKEAGALHLQKLDKVNLVEPIEEKMNGAAANGGEEAGKEVTEPAGDVFGIEEAESSASTEEGNGEIDFEELEAEAQLQSNEAASDMVDEAREETSNVFVLYNILSRYGKNAIRLGLNISAGDTVYQVMNGTDYNEVKKKDLVEDLEDKLESIYGEPPAKTNYNYKVREDGKLILASIKEEAPLLNLLNEAKEYYSGKLSVYSLYPDEVALASLVKENYDLDSNEITAVIQFGTKNCRFFFMRGDEMIHVAPLVPQGINDRNILNKVFSKLLFELDTGKVAGIDKIIVANNLLGDRAIEFLAQNFPNIEVEDLAFKKEILQHEGIAAETVHAFSTAIAAGWAASQKDDVSDLSFLPDYVVERQKTFKLKWHGISLLVLIFLVPFIFNYFYQSNKAQIDSFSSELTLVDSRLAQIEPIVQRTTEVSQNLSLLMNKLSLIDSLSTGSKVWSVNFSVLNEGMDAIPNSWFSSMTKTQEGTFIEGYTLYRSRVPAIVNMFHEATLLNVSIDKIRQKEIYRFSLLIKSFVADPAAYSPPQPENLKKLLGD